MEFPLHFHALGATCLGSAVGHQARMSLSKRRRVAGWGVVVAIVLFFLVSAMGSSSPQMAVAALLFAHLPAFIVPCYIVFPARELNSGIIRRAIVRGWPAFLVSGVLWEVCYRSLYQRFHWPPPDLPGEVLAGLLLGWLPASIITGIAALVRPAVIWVFPVPDDSPTA